jgi:peptidoglycan/xylan/chitin deacetylase (PgdA/CDA1 family)
MTEGNSGFRFPTSRIPYKDRKGVEVWPNGARMAVLVYTAPEEWCWGVNENMDPMASYRFGEEFLSLSTRSGVEYGYNVGLYRIAEIFAEHDMKTTLWTNGNTVEQHREILEELVAAGHELGGHGYSEGMPLTSMDRATQEDSVKRSVELLSEVAGTPPRGWVGPGAAADRNTIELLVENGFDYHGDLQDDELPYFLHVGDKSLVEIPYRMVGNLNDLPLQTVLGVMKSVGEVSKQLCEAFDAYYASAATHPNIINYGTHPFVTGRPDGSAVLRNFLAHVHSHDDVWVCSYAELADWWRERFGNLVPEGGGNIDVTAVAG